MKNHNALTLANRTLSLRQRAWLVSSSLHIAAVVSAVVILTWRVKPLNPQVDITIIESPRQAQQPVTLAKPKPVEKVKQRQVFGMSRKAVTAESGLEVKAGNTLAKTPDNDQLKPSDADSLPVPSEDYLVTAMPVLEHDIVVPYPPDAKKRGIEGAVVMDLLIDAGGNVRKVDLVEGPDPELSAAAVKAATGFKFKPARIQEKPVAVRIRYSYRFVIRG